MEPGPIANTRVVGAALDNQDTPIPGATVSILGTNLTTTTSDAGTGVWKGGWHCGGQPGQSGIASPGSITTNLPSTAKLKSDNTPEGGEKDQGEIEGTIIAKPAGGEFKTLENGQKYKIIREGEDPGNIEVEFTPKGPSGEASLAEIKITGTEPGEVTLLVTYLCPHTHHEIELRHALKIEGIQVEFELADGGELEDPHRLGITGPADGAIDQTQKLKAKVKPASATQDINIKTGPKLEIFNLEKGEGEITFELKATTKSTSPGDTFLKAQASDNEVLEELKISVVVPSQIGTPHPTANGEPQSRNLVRPVPADPRFSIRATQWWHYLNITVWDQFKEPIGDLYEGASVTENNGNKIGFSEESTTLDKNSRYIDPAGFELFVNPEPTDSFVIQTWKQSKQKIAGIINGEDMEEKGDVLVEIDGFRLNPSVINRTHIFTPPQRVEGIPEVQPPNLEIKWPD